ncbi:hypothetical protein GF373_00635 [bacterium]|nr:hypothetical protein [bacterium]
MINEDNRVADAPDGTINTIHYLKPGNDNYDGDYEPWLYDRAMTLYGIYIRSGNLDVLRQAHRNTFYYASHLDDEGYFNMKWSGGKPARDLKYSYAESLLTDILLTGDEKRIQDIEKMPIAASRFKYTYHPQEIDFWTERHFAFAWLIYIVAYEATGNAVYAEEARKRAETVFHHQQHPPVHPEHGQAPATGALMHSFAAHEGWWDASHPYWVFSPWMTALLVDAMQRYYLHSADERVLESAQRFGNAIMDSGMAVRDGWPDFGGYLIEGSPVPHYLAGIERGYYEWADYEHCLDVAKTTAFAYHCSILSHTPNSKYLQATDALLESARVVMDYWIRPSGPDYGKSIYRLAPPRKGNWWFRTTQDIDYLTQFENVGVERWIDY